METTDTTAATVRRKRHPRPHPARRARLAAGSASAVGMLVLTGWMASAAHANATRAATVTTAAGAAGSSSTSQSAASSSATQRSTTTAQAATPSTQVTTSSHGS